MALGLNRTTIAGPLTAADTRVAFASATTLAAKQIAYIDREAMILQRLVAPAIQTIWHVLRGQCGTFAAAHAANNPVFTGAPGQFTWTAPQGKASQDAVVALPQVNVVTGATYMISGNGAWQKGGGEVPAQIAIAPGTLATFNSNGTLAINNGSVEVNSASARAMTFPAPGLADEGTVIMIFGSGGGAHTVTPAGGFGGGGTVATFATGGGTLIVQVLNGKIRQISAIGVTIT